MSKIEKKNRVCWLSGGFFSRKQYIDKIRSLLGEHAYYSYGDDISFEYLQRQVFATDCFNDKRLIVVNDWPESNQTKETTDKKFLKLLDEVPEGCLVVLNGLQTKSDKFPKHIKNIGHVILSPEYFDIDKAISWLNENIHKKNKEIDSSDIQDLIYSISMDHKMVHADRLYLLLEKICHYTGNRKIITHDDILKITIESSHFIIWNLFNIIDKKDVNQSLKMVDVFLESEKDISAAANRMLHTMVWRYKLLLFLKEATAQKWTENQIIEESKKLYKLNRSSGFGMKTSLEIEKNTDGTIKSMYTENSIRSNLKGSYRWSSALQCYTRKHLFEILRAIDQTIEKTRFATMENEIILSLELLIILMCGKVPDKLIEPFRKYVHNKFE